MFLEEIYGISSAKGYANLRPVDRRRKRAIFILINCAEGISLYREKGVLNNPVSVSLLSGDRKPQIRF